MREYINKDDIKSIQIDEKRIIITTTRKTEVIDLNATNETTLFEILNDGNKFINLSELKEFKIKEVKIKEVKLDEPKKTVKSKK